MIVGEPDGTINSKKNRRMSGECSNRQYNVKYHIYLIQNA